MIIYSLEHHHKPGPEVLKPLFLLNSTEHEISLGDKNKNTKKLKKKIQAQLISAELSMKKVSKFCQYFKIYKHNKFHAQLSWAWKKVL